MTIRRTLAAAFVAITIAVPGAALPGSPAAAAPACGGQAVNNSDDGWGLVDASPLRQAPYGHCGVVANLAQGTRIYFHCWVVNDYGNFWVWARVAGTERYGWMYRENINTIGGSWVTGYCPGEPN